MKVKQRLLFRLLSVVCLFIVGLFIAGILFPLLTLIFGHQAKHYRDALKMCWLNWFAGILHCRITVTGECPKPGAMVVCNHISWLDIIALGCYLPGCFVAKSDILSWPVIGYLSRQAGTVFIRRGDKKNIHSTTEKMLWILKQGSNIMTFPEGTTTFGEDVLPFHSSIFQSAILTKATIQPVAIRYQSQARQQAPFIGDDEFLPHLFKILALEQIEIDVNFLPVINTAGKTRLTVSDDARTLIRTAILAETLPQIPVARSV